MCECEEGMSVRPCEGGSLYVGYDVGEACL